MRNFDVDVNIADFLEDGYEKLLPKNIREKLDGRTLCVEVCTYPFYKDGKCYAEKVDVKSPKTYGDIINAYTDFILDIDEKAKTDSTWECLHTADCLWVENIAIDVADYPKGKPYARVDIGS